MKFQIGDRAYKPKGYQYPCTIVSVFTNTSGETRIVGEMDFTKMLHIFNEDQLEHMSSEMEKDIYSKFKHFFSEDIDYNILQIEKPQLSPPPPPNDRLIKEGQNPPKPKG